MSEAKTAISKTRSPKTYGRVLADDSSLKAVEIDRSIDQIHLGWCAFGKDLPVGAQGLGWWMMCETSLEAVGGKH